MSLNKFKENKSIGYYFSIVITLLFLITGIIYLVGVKGNAVLDQYEVLNIVSVVFLFGGFGISLIVMLLQAFNIIPAKLNIVPWLQGACALGALSFFILGGYYYVSVVMVGIDLDHYEGIFLVFVALFLVLFGLGVANIFLKQTKETKENINE